MLKIELPNIEFKVDFNPSPPEVQEIEFKTGPGILEQLRQQRVVYYTGALGMKEFERYFGTDPYLKAEKEYKKQLKKKKDAQRISSRKKDKKNEARNRKKKKNEKNFFGRKNTTTKKDRKQFRKI